MAQTDSEVQVITELLELYRDLPCLWDLSSEAYKDSTKKKHAWDILAEKLKEIDPTANAASAKKKIDNLRISYLRESKKVKKSRNTGSSTNDVHIPKLWYFDLLKFLEKKHEVMKMGVDSLMSDNEDKRQIDKAKRKKITREHNIEMKKEKLIDTAHDLLTTTTESNAFGVYVGKKMEEISVGQQRDLAEKLISDIIFLAKTNNLTFDTRIEIPPRTRLHSSHNPAQSFSIHSPPSAQFSQSPYSSPAASSNSYHYVQIQSSDYSQTQRHPPSSRSHHISHTASSPPLHSPNSIKPKLEELDGLVVTIKEESNDNSPR